MPPMPAACQRCEEQADDGRKVEQTIQAMTESSQKISVSVRRPKPSTLCTANIGHILR